MIRRDALEEAGRWADWCLTEDSEIAIRLHALGYHGFFFPQTRGRGLIPESFSDYQKQRFRWTAGPVQAGLRHWRLLVPPILGGVGKMTLEQRFWEIVHGTEAFGVLGMWISIPLLWFIPSLIELLAPRVRVTFPLVLVLSALFGLLSGLIQEVHILKMSLGTEINMVALILRYLAVGALSFIKMIAVPAALFSNRPLQWVRTPKFRQYRQPILALLKELSASSLKWTWLLSANFFLLTWYWLSYQESLGAVAILGCLAAFGVFVLFLLPTVFTFLSNADLEQKDPNRL